MRAFAIFVISALVVAVSGVAVILLAQSSSDFDPELHFEFPGMGAMVGGFIVFVSEAVIVAIVSARRHQLAEWLAGFAGVVLGIVPYWIMFGWLNATACGPTYICTPDSSAGEVLAAAVQAVVLMVVPVAGMVFLAVGLVAKAGSKRRLPARPAGPG